jgi:hypothetical protein
MEKFNNLTKKNFKKNQKIFREIFFSIFFWLSRFHIQFGACLRKFGGLGPLVWEEIENEQTVHKGLAKLLYRFGGLGPLVWEEIENEQTVHKGLAKLLYRYRCTKLV